MVTQVTSKSTAVTLNKPCGAITMHNAALAGGASVGFTVTNSVVGANDIPIVRAWNNANYRVDVLFATAGAFGVNITNMTAGSLSEAFTLHFAIIKGSIS